VTEGLWAQWYADTIVEPLGGFPISCSFLGISLERRQVIDSQGSERMISWFTGNRGFQRAGRFFVRLGRLPLDRSFVLNSNSTYSQRSTAPDHVTAPLPSVISTYLNHANRDLTRQRNISIRRGVRQPQNISCLGAAQVLCPITSNDTI
jgi:hypothetical protein